MAPYFYGIAIAIFSDPNESAMLCSIRFSAPPIFPLAKTMNMRALRVLLALISILALLAGCALVPGKEGVPEMEKTYYFDAELGFTIDYPAAWSRLRSRSEPAVRWRDGADGDIRAVVASRPLGPTTGGYDKMLAIFTLGHPDLVLAERREVKLGDTVPALRLTGSTVQRTILAFLVKTDKRAYVLEFSAPSEHFPEFRPLFEEMARSFTPL